MIFTVLNFSLLSTNMHNFMWILMSFIMRHP